MIGRADLLTQVSRGAAHLDDLDLNPLLIRVDGADKPATTGSGRARWCRTRSTREIVTDAEPFFKDGEKMQLSYAVQNTLRSIGTRVSSHIVKRFGMSNTLQPDHLTIKLVGLGRAVARRLRRAGAQDRGLGRGERLRRQGAVGRDHRRAAAAGSPLVAAENAIIGNTVLYGATAGSSSPPVGRASGSACGTRARRSVIEGCGSNGCEYMTGGVAVILGRSATTSAPA